MDLRLRAAFNAFLVVAAPAVLLTLVSPWLAERMLFLPDRSDPGPPPRLAGVAGEEVALEAEDGVRLHAWWWDAGPDAPAVLLLHGNAGHIGHRIPLAAGLVERGVSVLLLDYRGYGRSEGRPSEAGVRRDAEAGLRLAIERAGGAERVVVFGRSLGGVLAAGLAAESQVAGAILEAAFTSLEGIASAVYPYLPAVLFRRLRGRFDALAALGRVRAPVLVVHGTRDRIVPPAMGRALVEATAGPAEWYPVEGADHNDPFVVGGEAYFDRLAAFVHRVAGTTP
jgi:hypothetical protein